MLNNMKLEGNSFQNVTWRLKDIMNSTDKEAYPFNFAGFNWTLVTKMQKASNKKSTLSFYLKLLNEQHTSNNTPTHEKIEIASRIITVYYQFNCNGLDLSKNNLVKCLQINKNQTMLLWKFDHKELESLALYDNEFSIKMNLDIIYSGILTHISKYIENYYQSKNINTLALTDIFALLEKIPKISKAHDAAFGLLYRWGIIVLLACYNNSL